MEQNTVIETQLDWETIFITIAINFISFVMAMLVVNKMM